MAVVEGSSLLPLGTYPWSEGSFRREGFSLTAGSLPMGGVVSVSVASSLAADSWYPQAPSRARFSLLGWLAQAAAVPHTARLSRVASLVEDLLVKRRRRQNCSKPRLARCCTERSSSPSLAPLHQYPAASHPPCRP